MKFQNYIIEEEEGLNFYIPKIQRECKPFIRDIKGASGTLYRLESRNRDKPIWKKPVRKDRRPLDTTEEIHKAMDNLFLKEFGWRARSQGLFCWARMFSHPAFGMKLVFPVGNYEYLWSDKVEDLWNALASAPGMEPEKNVEYFKKHFLNSYHKDKIKMAMKYENEMMVKCDYAYIIKQELMEQVDERLGLNWQGAVFRGRKI